jgi:glyoxylase-like metal-dependent hydrolase (beta-lactamase superfamily II)
MNTIHALSKKTAVTFGGILFIAIVFLSFRKKPASGVPELKVEVITASLKGFAVNSTLITGANDAILIDAQLLKSDADVLVGKIKSTGKNLTVIYITHSHPDHYFGLVELKKAFPDAKIVALPAVVADINKTWQSRVNSLKQRYGDDITTDPVIPDELNGNTLTLEGQKLQVFGNVQGDEGNSSYVWIPSIKTVITGDVDFYGVFPWTLETTPAQRVAWIKTLDKIASLKPAVVIPGHQDPNLKDDPSSIAFTIEYLHYYDKMLPMATSSAQFQEMITTHYPTLIEKPILQKAADAAFSKK